MSDHPQRPKNAGNSPAMPPTVVHRTSDDDDVHPRVAEILDAYFDKLQAGNAPSVDEVLAAHPEHAEELAACLDGIHLVQDAGPSTANPIKSDQRLGDFRIIREVGRGGMGVVYEAEQISLKRRVALKVLRHMVADREAMERFEREAETVASLHHSNIVPIFAVGEADGVNYFAMQFIDGESLADVQSAALAEKTFFEPSEVANWGLQAAEALAYAHDRDIIHRDVKPSNLIRDTEGRVWLTDFGLAKRIDDVQLSMTGAILGTPRYMSPEQANSVKTPVDHRTDIYSLGATLYEFATGEPLFDATTTHAALGSILSDEPTAPREIRPSLPRDLETIIMRCLSKDAVHRYESAVELVADLRAFIDGRPIQARRPGVVELLGRWLQKNQRQVTTAATAAAMAALLLVGTRVGLQEYRQAQLGRFHIESTRRLPTPVVATIVAKDGSPVVPSFTLPTQQVVEVPRGDYELQLQADGELTDHYQLSVYPSQGQRVLKTHLEDHNVWKPREISSEWAVWSRDGGDDLLVFEDDGVTLLDAAKNQEVWRSDLQSEPMLKETAGPYRKEAPWSWRTQHTANSDFYEQPAIVGDSFDCNQDGSTDLILACRYHPMVIALSGDTGELLWRNHIPHQENQSSYEAGTVRGTPLLKDINHDGVRDLIACFMTKSSGGEKCLVRGVDGSDGSTLWQEEVDPTYITSPRGIPYPPYMARWYTDDVSFFHGSSLSRRGLVHATGSSNESHIEHGGVVAPFPLQFAPGTDGGKFVLCVRDSLFVVDAKTGKFERTIALSGEAVRTPQWVDVDADGTDELLVCVRNLPKPANRTGLTVAESPPLALELLDVKTGSTIWKKDIEANWEWGMLPSEIAAESRRWPLITDIDGDGFAEIILPATSTAGDDGWTTEPYGSLQLLDARTGVPKWASTPVVNIECQLSHFAVVDDLDDDGLQDVVVVSRFSKTSYEAEDRRQVPFSIYADVFSGKDGKPIRRIESASIVRHNHDFAHIQSLQIHEAKVWVELRRNWQEGLDRSLCFDLGSGVCDWTLNDVQRLTPVAFDSTTHGFVCWTPNKSGEPRRGGVLRAFRQTTHSTEGTQIWKYADQQLRKCGDVNGDGIEDAISSPDKFGAINMVSGANGDYLWSKETSFSEALPAMADFDGDGYPDVLLSTDEKTDTPISLVSGRTGNRLWRMRMSKMLDWKQQRVIADDIDGDGQLDLLVYAESDYHRDAPIRFGRALPSCVFYLHGRTGKLLHSKELGEVGHHTGAMFVSFQETANDINGDTYRDIVGYHVDTTGSLRLNVTSGQDGTTIWSDGNLAVKEPADNRTRYPHFCAVQTDRPTIVSAGSVGYQAGGTGPDRQRMIVKAIDGTDGEDLWEWVTPMYFRGSGIGFDRETTKRGEELPVLVRTQHGPRIGVWHTNKASVEFSLLHLGPDGTVSERVADTFTIHQWENNGPNWTFVYGLRVWAKDLDGEAIDELIYSTPNNIVVYSLTKEAPLWTYPFTDRQRITSVEQSEDRRLEIRFSSLDNSSNLLSFSAIDGQGELLWTETPPEAWKSREPPDILENKHGPPKMLYRLPNRTTLCRSVTAARSEVVAASESDDLLARVTRSPNSANFDVSAATDPRFLRPAVHIGEFGQVMRPMLLSILMIFAPLLYIRQLLRGRWTLKVLMLAPLVAAMFLVGMRLPAEFVPRYSGLAAWNLQRAFSFATVVVPSGVIVISIIQYIRTGRWRALLAFLATITVCGFIYVVAFSVLDRDYSASALPIRYDWSGLGLKTFFLGTHAAGVLICIWRAAQWLWGWFSRRIKVKRGAALA